MPCQMQTAPDSTKPPSPHEIHASCSLAAFFAPPAQVVSQKAVQTEPGEATVLILRFWSPL